MRALVTGFDAFGGEAVNASLDAVRQLPPRIGRLEVTTAELPTSYARSLVALEAAIAAAGPQIVLCVGQAGDHAALCVERVAVNVQDSRIPDNDGAQATDTPVVAGGPTAYLATLPVRAIVAALHAAELPAEISMSAGTFVCNHVFYGLMHLAALRPQPFCGGFLHVPRLPQQAGNASAMALDDIARGIAVVLETAARHAKTLN
jgi:pyroglutamyl-peptidase